MSFTCIFLSFTRKTGNRSSSNEQDCSILIHTLCKNVERLSTRVNNRISVLQRSHLSWRKTEKVIVQRLVTDMCKRARGIEGSQKEEEMQAERDAFKKLSFKKLENMMMREDEPRLEFERLKSVS